ncbi:M48 family metalloprotease [Microbulbifer sp. TYP-18]|uniref:M48 family metalloprotease n=1 Tax=Microbulbifer sp. TYP-18 TaxID=3230024 RepID=UPI0034C63C48
MHRNYTKLCKNGICTALMAASVGCANIAPLEAGKPIKADTEGASRLWHAADEFEHGLVKMGLVYQDPALTQYVQSVYDRLFPEFAGNSRVKILNDTALNAFALPNGNIYVNSGLIATLENEAQLASVLSHEGIHFIHRHSERQRQSNSVAAGVGLSAAMLGIPFAHLFVYGSMSGYSRSLEREADKEGLTRYLNSGYAGSEAAKAFEALDREAQLQEEESVPYFFSSHPKLKARITSYREMTATQQEGGDILPQIYADNIRPIWLSVLDGKLSSGNYSSLIGLAEQNKFAREFGAQNVFYAAEAFRLRNEEGDIAKATEYYQTSIERNPNYAPPYRALGIIAYKKEDFVGAAEYFERYLVLAPSAPESAFVKQYLETIRTKAKS